LLPVLTSPWLAVTLVASVVAFFASARGMQDGEAIPVIAATSTAANVSAILGGIVVFGDPMPTDIAGMLVQAFAFVLVVVASPDEQAAYVARLARHGLSGLGLGTGFAHAEVPDALATAAEEVGFPLFEVPYELPFIAITEKASSHLVNEHYAVLQRAISAHE